MKTENSTTKIYIYSDEATANSIVMTAYYLGFECHAIGSAVVMDDDVFDALTEKTQAPDPVIVAVEFDKSDFVKPGRKCPGCGESRIDYLLWQDDIHVECQTCGIYFEVYSE